jgi:hypothetical protein
VAASSTYRPFEPCRDIVQSCATEKTPRSHNADCRRAIPATRGSQRTPASPIVHTADADRASVCLVPATGRAVRVGVSRRLAGLPARA